MFPLTPYEEKLLLKKISEGSEEAFRALYDTYFNRLSVFIFKLCKSPTITEELVQDVFVKLWVNRKELDQINAPEAYIFSMARNKSFDYLRHLARESGLIALLAEQSCISNNEIEAKLNAEELKHLIENALTRLSAQKKMIFRLSRDEGLSHDEIAERMQLSKSTVKNHLSETLKHIRGHISRLPNHEALLLLLILFPPH